MAKLIAIGTLALAHMLVGKLRFIESERRSAWLSASGGAALAYVFLYVLPALASKQQLLVNATTTGVLGFLEHHVYLVAMLGVLVFYGVDEAAKSARHAPHLHKRRRLAKLLALKIHVFGFAGYSVLVGYLVTELPSGRYGRLVCMVSALTLHFVGTDYHLRHEDPRLYDRVIRWILVMSVIAGWLLGLYTQVAPEVLAMWFAFLSGSIMILVIRDELPHEGHAVYWPFVFGAVMYSVLLYSLEYYIALETSF